MIWRIGTKIISITSVNNQLLTNSIKRKAVFCYFKESCNEVFVHVLSKVITYAQYFLKIKSWDIKKQFRETKKTITFKIGKLLWMGFFFSFQGHTCCLLKFPGQGLNQSCSFQPTPQQQRIRALSVTYTTAHSNAGSLTY